MRRRLRPLLERARRPALAALAFVLAFLFLQWWDLTLPSLGRASYQAVFLANGQTYFGRYYDRLGPYSKIESVYYIQQVRSGDPEKPPESKLVRRGGELHGPVERVLVPRTAILLIEDLQEASPVARFMEQERRARAGR